MANTPRLVSAYTLDALTPLSPKPIAANRAPTTADTGYIPGQLWIFVANNAAYILTSVANGLANWLLIETSGGAGVFTTLVSTGQFNLDTTAVGANTLGNTTGGTSLAISVGTGGFSVTGVAGSAITIGTGVTTGAISFAGDQTTGTLNIGGTGANSGTATILGGTGAQIVNIANSTGGKTVNIATGAGINDVVIGSLTTSSQTIIQAGTNGLELNAGGAVTVATATNSTATTTAVINKNVGQATFTGQTTAAAGSLVLTITNSVVSATSAILVSAANQGSNDAQMTVTRVQPGTGSFVVTLLNNGAAALNGDVLITFWVVAV
jgi:hypothetical protein